MPNLSDFLIPYELKFLEPVGKYFGARISSAVSSAKSGAMSSAKSSVENATGLNISDVLNQFGKGLNSSLEKALSSALDAEFSAAAKQMEFQRQSNRDAMQFEAEQNEINRIFQQSSAQRAMNFEAEQSAINRNWQEMMSNTSYQRAVADMQAAGLNPILAVTQGGASTPAGSSGSGFSASGSAAKGYSSAGAKADAAAGKSSDMQFISIILNSAADLLSAVGQILPG